MIEAGRWDEEDSLAFNVLRDAGIPVVLVVNKIDRDFADPEHVHDLVLELFLELDADEEQFNAPFLYGSAKNGFMVKNLEDPQENMQPLFETVVENIPAPEADTEGEFRMLVSNIDWDNYVGRVAVGKVLSGKVETRGKIFRVLKDGTRERAKITKVFEYTGLGSSESALGEAGNIVGIAGFEEVNIGETLCFTQEQEALPFVEIDPPTIQMQFAVNDGPLGGRDGKLVTSRQIRERLFREMKTNVSIHAEDTEKSGVFNVSARGAMQISVLVETMRREGFELGISRPRVLFREENGQRMEPFETVVIDVDDEHSGTVVEKMQRRKAELTEMRPSGQGKTRITFSAPSRGLIGYHGEFLSDTRGTGIMNRIYEKYDTYRGKIEGRQNGVLISMVSGEAVPYALNMLEERGELFIGGGAKIYEGIIIGENAKPDDLEVNPMKSKQLTNFRSTGKDDAIRLTPPRVMTLEQAIAYIDDDEMVEVTPANIRIRKAILDPHERKKASRKKEAA